MDEQEYSPELEGLDLEDIMREFSSGGEPDFQAPVLQEPQQLLPEDAIPQALESQVMEPETLADEQPQPEAGEPAQQESPVNLEATAVLPTIGAEKQESRLSDTMAIPVVEATAKMPAQVDGATRKIPKMDGKTAAIPVPAQDAQNADVEQDEYVPYKPIRFQPKDRLRSLKRKLVAGPEKRFYELSEIGVGKVQVAMLLSLLVFFASAAITAVAALGYMDESRQRLMVFIQFFGMMMAALLGCYQMMEGVADLFRGRFSMNTMLVITFIVCCVDGVFCFRQERVPCCAAFSLQATMSLWGAYHKRVTEMGQMDTLRKASRIYGIYTASDYHEGSKGLLRAEGDVDDFMQNYQAATGPEKVFTWYGFFAMLACAGIGIAGGVLQKDASFGVQVGAAALLTAVPVTSFITLSRPQAILGKRLHRVGGVICGWQGVNGMKGKAYFAMTHEDLFPVGTCKLNGVKFFGSRESKQVISYAWALVNEVGGALAPLFDHLLETQGGFQSAPESLRTYPNGGVGGEVDGESVLVGTQPFLKSMGVEVPEGIRVNHAVYIAVDGELCGLVAVTYVKHRSPAAGIGTLCAHRGLFPVLTTGDFMLTEDFIREKFNVNPKRMLFPERQVRRELSRKQPDKDMPALALTTRDDFAAYTYCVTGARVLRTAQKLGVVVHLVAGILGILMMAALALLGAGHLLTPANMLLYQLVWLLPGWLLTEWTRHI